MIRIGQLPLSNDEILDVMLEILQKGHSPLWMNTPSSIGRIDIKAKLYMSQDEFQ